MLDLTEIAGFVVLSAPRPYMQCGCDRKVQQRPHVSKVSRHGEDRKDMQTTPPLPAVLPRLHVLEEATKN